MNIIERLISGYPSGDVAPQDFIDHLRPQRFDS